MLPGPKLTDKNGKNRVGSAPALGEIEGEEEEKTKETRKRRKKTRQKTKKEI